MAGVRDRAGPEIRTDMVRGEPAAAISSPYLVTIGDIGVTSHWVVTPNGTAPVAGSQWIVTDTSRTEFRTPGWAIIFAICFTMFCLIGLFFLLVKESYVTGYVEVSVRSENLYHKTQIAISQPIHVQQIRGLVSEAQMIAAQAESN